MKPYRRHWVALPLLLFILSGCTPKAAIEPKNVVSAVAISAPSFVDRTKEAGLDFTQSHGGCGLYYFVEQVAAGAATLDANGDGNLDLYFPAPKPLGKCVGKTKGDFRQRLYLGDGKGHFRLAPNAFGKSETEYGIAAAVGDYDNDGHPDIYVCCSGHNTLYHNRGDGTFEDVTARAGVAAGGFSTGAVWFDYDGDGKLDLYVLRYCKWSVRTDQACYGPHGERDSCSPQNYVAETNILYHNNGDGTFTDVTARSLAAPDKRRSLSAVAIDFDGDGKLDLFVANDLGPNYLLHNNGDGTFTDQAIQNGVAFGGSGNAQANMGIAVGDYDNHGELSLLVTTFANEPYTLYRNDGGLFTDVSREVGIALPTLSYLGFGTGFIDTRNSGTLDLFFANGHISPTAVLKDPMQTYKERNQLFVNDGKGRFTEDKKALPGGDVKIHRGVIFGDFDNDGRMDILVTATNDRPTLLHNESKAGNWLLVKLIDKEGCVTPVGARCTTVLQNKKLLRAVVGGGSYGGESDYRLHFGLGSATQIDRLEIRWLDGKKQVLTNLTANQIVAVKED